MTTDTQLQDDERDEYDASYMEGDEELYEPYKSVSKMAMASLLLALFALIGLVFPALLLAALLAVLFGVLGQRNLRRYPDELTGKPAAFIGLVGGVLLLVGGTAMHTYIYMTEVPEGYERMSFNQLQMDKNAVTPLGLPDLPVELDGKRVFVKGYVHPGVADVGEIRNFVLVPDMGTCCFGGQPDLSDMIEVNVKGERGLRYSQRKRKLAGTFHISFRSKKVAGDLNGGYFALDADYVR